MFFCRERINNLLPKKQQRDLYRRVFSGVEGNKVLVDILIDLCFWDEIESEDKVSFEEKAYLRNAAYKILRKCGVWDSQNIEQLLKAMLNIPRKVKR